MSAVGYIQVRAYTSNAQLPLEDVAVTVTTTGGTAIAMRLTDSSGKIALIEVPVPNRSESLQPEPGETPYGVANLYAHLEGYDQINAENLQIFADTVTVQDLELIPQPEFPEAFDTVVAFQTTPQNL